jgi:hypothetical protein
MTGNVTRSSSHKLRERSDISGTCRAAHGDGRSAACSRSAVGEITCSRSCAHRSRRVAHRREGRRLRGRKHVRGAVCVAAAQCTLYCCYGLQWTFTTILRKQYFSPHSYAKCGYRLLRNACHHLHIPNYTDRGWLPSCNDLQWVQT